MRKIHMFGSVTAIALMGTLAGTAQAATIVSYENDALIAGATSAPTNVVNGDVSATALAFGAGLPASNWPDALTGLQNNAAINSLATAITNDEYFTLTVTPDGGKQVSYSTMSVNYTLGANVQPASTVFSLLSSTTGFTAADSIDSFTGIAATAFATGSDSFDLSGSAVLQNNTSAVELRIYVYNSGANSMTRIGIGTAFNTSGADDLLLEGTVTDVPEPGSIALLGLGGALLLPRKRR